MDLNRLLLCLENDMREVETFSTGCAPKTDLPGSGSNDGPRGDNHRNAADEGGACDLRKLGHDRHEHRDDGEGRRGRPNVNRHADCRRASVERFSSERFRQGRRGRHAESDDEERRRLDAWHARQHEGGDVPNDETAPVEAVNA